MPARAVTIAVGLFLLVTWLCPQPAGAGMLASSPPDVNEVRFSVPITLYDAALGTTPDHQGFLYAAYGFPPLATQTFTGGVTVLDTTGQRSDLAGYAVPTATLYLDRAMGYSLDVVLQVVTETHTGSDRNGDGIDDRAGFSLLVLSNDAKGIELGFWPNQVWAQQDGSAEPPGGTLFTHAESAALDTTAGLIHYRLNIVTDTYTLAAEGIPVLQGRVRDYTAFVAPPIAPANPYRTPNLIFMGDNSTSSMTRVRIASATIWVTIVTRVFLPVILR